MMAAYKPRSADPKVLVMVLAGGEGRRLHPLTADRAKPAVPFGGSYRIIDFVLSNFANAGYRKIVVLTQYKSHSLDRHISQTWRFSTLLGNYVTPVPAQMRRGPRWFSGSADAIYQNLNLISDENPDVVCVFGADHIYHMDPRQMVEQHLDSGAGVTVAAIPVPIDQGPQFGIIEANAEGKITRFLEKPSDPPSMHDDPTRALASMGNYVFSTKTLVDVVTPAGEDQANTDVGGDVIPVLTSAGVAHMYDFSTNIIPGQADHERGYWRDVGSIDVYYDANMDLLAPVPLFSLYNREWPMYSLQLPLPPAKLCYGSDGSAAHVSNSLLGSGTIVSGGIVDRSVIAPDVYIDSRAHVTDSILMPGVRVGPGARLHRCIMDKNVYVPAGMQIGIDHQGDRDRFDVSEGGIVVVAKERSFGPK